MKRFILMLSGLAVLVFTGCVGGPTAPFAPPPGAFVSDTRAPLTTEFNATPTKDLKCGSAIAYNVLGLFAFGDCSLTTAAETGGLTTIEYADYENFNILCFFQKTTVKVYGK